MAVNTPHEEYTEYKKQWDRCRDCIAGQDEVHEAGEKYLPRLSGQTNADYAAYKSRALFYGATGRTLDGLSGMIFRKAPQIETPAAIVPLLENITLDGMDLQGFAESVVDDVIAVGRCGILVDHPNIEGSVISKAQAETMNIRPFLRKYAAESIINWRYDTVLNTKTLVELRLMESIEVREKEFEYKEVEQIRVLDLDDAGFYRQRVFQMVKSATNANEWEQVSPDIYPLLRGAKMTKIPFYFAGVKNNDACPDKPPLIDLVDANLSHYRNTADIEHGAHYTALPTAVITGVQEDDKSAFAIGPSTAWVMRDPNAKAFYLEFTGQGLGALEARLAAKEAQMAALGARMLAPEKNGVEAAQTAAIRQSGETSVLASLAQSVSTSIEKALRMVAEWAGATGEIVFKLNTDFMPVIMTPQELTALVDSWQRGAISHTVLFENLKGGEIIAAETTLEEMQAEIEQQSPFQAQDMPQDAGGNV